MSPPLIVPRMRWGKWVPALFCQEAAAGQSSTVCARLPELALTRRATTT